MIKEGWKPSSDPAQQKLREAKARWNKKVSDFITSVIGFKKTMNGWPSQFHNDKSKITEAIPADPVTIISILADDFNKLAKEASEISASQANYSNLRKKKQQPISINGPGPVSLSDKISGMKPDLVSEGSNPVSRFITRVMNPSIGFSSKSRIRRMRIAALNASARTFKDLEKLQVEVVKSSKPSIAASNDLLRKAWNNWSLVYREFLSYKNSISPNQVGEVSKSNPEYDTDVNDFVPNSENDVLSEDEVYLKNLSDKSRQSREANLAFVPSKIKDFNHFLNESRPLNLILDENKLNKFSDYINKYVLTFNNQKISKDVKMNNAVTFMSNFNNLLNSINNKNNINAKSFSELLTTKIEPNKDIESDNELLSTNASLVNKTAQDFLKKWIGKTHHQLKFYDETSSYRLDVYKKAEETRDLLDNIMNSLEKDYSVEELNFLMTEVNKKMLEMRSIMRALNFAFTKGKEF